ncbi:hypothetical protein [Paenibacillus oleatilyticus]|uniref:hypothetical protein n=1 Tax=Paenibacillus oleatilyticus TaxID=2594886 RepID=UPI001C1FC86C|nr:hypothetical protein [Paenibacillus oleatilyticus]MBU7319008.1 hypothetical protein [Paenibacillus oleatilyticus]
MIRLTKIKNEGYVWVNPESVVAIWENETGVGFGKLPVVTFIETVAGKISVTESPEEIAHKVLNYRLAMVRHMASSQAAYFNRAKTENPWTPTLEEWNVLLDLAGLSGLEAERHE